MADTASTDMVKISNAGAGILPGMTNLALFKQIGVLVGIAASIALGVYLALWSNEPPMRPLGDLPAEASMDAINYLEQQQIKYRVDASGKVLVPQSRFKRIQIELAAQGIATSDAGDESYLKKDSGFGVSQRMEKARLLRNQELQLNNTLAQFSGVKSAKVHLAIPKESSFIKNRKQPSASVLLNLYSRGGLDDEQVNAIVDLVSASIPNLQANKVTITDQFGRLYHSGSMGNLHRQSARELSITRDKQDEIKSRIEHILNPIVGPDAYTVQVNVDMDFTKREQTLQTFNPDLPAVRSERVIEDSRDNSTSGGVPGALTNQPPQNSTVAENATANPDGTAVNGNHRKEAERNYDLDTTISHVLPQVGIITRISVSVGLDQIADPQDATKKIARPAEELSRITNLIQAAIGFSSQRGDIVSVDSFPFIEMEPLPEPEPPAFHQGELFQTLLKPVIALLLGLVLIFAVLKPTLKKLSTAPPVVKNMLPPAANTSNKNNSSQANENAQSADESVVLAGHENLELPPPTIGEVKKLEMVKGVVNNNPTLAAQLVKKWIETDA